MREFPPVLNLKKVRVYPLAQRQSLSTIDELLVDPQANRLQSDPATATEVGHCASRIAAARRRKASVMLMYGAHLIKNGAQRIVNELVAQGWVTHLATNGAGSIHDWE